MLDKFFRLLLLTLAIPLDHKSSLYFTNQDSLDGASIGLTKVFFNATNLAIMEGRTGFHDVIGYNYRNPTDGSNSTVVESLPLARGTFHDLAFRRILNYHQYQLPYNPIDTQEGDEGYSQAPEPPSAMAYDGWSEPTWREEFNCYERYRYGPDGEPEYHYSANQ